MVDHTNKKGFELVKAPTSYQLAVHINNMLNTYGKDFIKVFKAYLYNPETLNDPNTNDRVKDLINYYSVVACQKWFTDIYGWDFRQKAG